MEEMRYTEKERRRAKVSGAGEKDWGGESPSPVEASSHEGLKVDGAGERWKGASTERREVWMDGRSSRNRGMGIVSWRERHKQRISRVIIK
jgi:hypothetical protein